MDKIGSGQSQQSFNWLHLSDLHVGMADQDWLWPTLKHALYADMKGLLSKTGPWDLVIFSGDLTQRGTPDEFEKLDTVLLELWNVFKNWGFIPKLIVLPGNHDVCRPPSLSPELRLLKKWWDEPDIQREFFASGKSVYRDAIDSLFIPYKTWIDRGGTPGIELLVGTAGILPGDSSYVFKMEKFNVGLVALNSTWLQIDSAEYKEKLHVDTKQLLAVTNNDPHAWCNGNAINIVITHHPISWLQYNSLASWNSDINPSNRFDLHLFGHMHEPWTSSISAGGGAFKNSIQAASTFGLSYANGTIERIHGYSVASFERDKRKITLWPRKLRKIANGDRKLGPDLDFDLSDNNSIEIQLSGSLAPAESPADSSQIGSVTLTSIPDDAREILKKVRYQLPFSKAHLNVRKVEQRKLIEMISDARAAWVAAEWGMGSDGFLSGVRQIRRDFDRPVYRLDLTDYENRDRFLETIKEILECSFEKFCELISQSGDSLLLLDNFPAGMQGAGGTQSLDRDIEELVTIILEYCPKLVVLLRSRRIPNSNQLPYVHLISLDEADLHTYVLEHERGGAGLASHSSASLLLRYTDGIPTRIDRALKELEVTSLSELVNTDFDLIGAAVDIGETSPALAKAVQALSLSTDAMQQRSFSLLKILSLFPLGEQLSRVRRFYSVAPIFPAHATELLDQALIEVTTVQGFKTAKHDPLAKRFWCRDQFENI